MRERELGHGAGDPGAAVTEPDSPITASESAKVTSVDTTHRLSVLLLPYI
jgi:hypothetical protein